MNDDKIRERRLRRAAIRQGLVLRKSRARDPRALTYGTYMLTADDTGTVIVGMHYGYGMTLDDIENALTEGPTFVRTLYGPSIEEAPCLVCGVAGQAAGYGDGNGHYWRCDACGSHGKADYTHLYD